MHSGIDPYRPRRPARRWPWLVAVALLIAAGLLAARHLLQTWNAPPEVATRAASPPPPAAPATAPPPMTPPEGMPAEPATEEPLPPLADADDLVRQTVQALSARPELVAWLGGTELVQRFAATVENVAGGESPRPHLPFLAPRDAFQTVERDGRTFIDPRSYARYDTVADVVASLDTPGSVELLHRLHPLLEHADLGHGDERFDDALARAAGVVLGTPVVEGNVALTERVTTWAFADPALERLSPPQKHLLRMGPRNLRLIQAKVRELTSAAGIVPAAR